MLISRIYLTLLTPWLINALWQQQPGAWRAAGAWLTLWLIDYSHRQARLTSPTTYADRLVWGLLALAALPWEAWLPATVDILLQTLTASAAGWLCQITQLPTIQITATHGTPALQLLKPPLIVEVSAWCAGLAPCAAYSTLGLVLAALCGLHPLTKLGIAFGTTVWAWLWNTLRIAVSAHMAAHLADSMQAWPLWHDIIGYTAFILSYAILWIWVLRLRHRNAANTAIITSAISGNNNQSPYTTKGVVA